jgi:hypothetical protein
MPGQLDILALEPFYGGDRRAMLETLVRYSRHRWTVLKLPPRRMERRLTAAATWFAEQLSIHWTGRVDLLFTSEALNLSDFHRYMPPLANKPAVVYFHSNQLPAPWSEDDSPLDFVNITTGTASVEMWFNSLFHMGEFLFRAGEVVKKHPELSSQSPVPGLTRKSRLMLPPTDLHVAAGILEKGRVPRERHNIFVDTRDADLQLLNKGFNALRRRGEKFNLLTVGPIKELAADFPRTTLSENDGTGHVAAMLKCGVIVSARLEAVWDRHAVSAISAGCWPVVPLAGVYPEIVPEDLHPCCTYDGTPESLASRVQDYWHTEPPDGADAGLRAAIKKYDAIAACKAMDDRLSELAGKGVAGR